MGSFKLVKLLIDNGADANGRDKKNATPLHIASQRGLPETVKLLLDHRADPNAQNDKGWTPLHIASREGVVDVVKCLLARRQRCAPSAAIGSEYPRGSFDLSNFTRTQTKINQV